ncbi:MAG: DinB family protein [Gemmatimonadetes bacterium]|nr:DinB family protein [Gemmatimonadota bacterium]
MNAMTRVLAVLLLAAPNLAPAQQPMNREAGRGSVVAATRPPYETFKGYIVRAAEQMPEANYSFRATPEVRSFGELLGHIANSNYEFCSAALKEQNPLKEDVEKSRTTRAALAEALRTSFQYCDRVYSEITDAMATEPIQLFGMDLTRLGVVTLNAAHDGEHYGNIVTYMRLKGLVPPSSQPSP